MSMIRNAISKLSLLKSVSDQVLTNNTGVRFFAQGHKWKPRTFNPNKRPVVESVTGRIWGSLVLERYPIVVPEPPAWETEFQEWSWMKQQEKRKELPKLFTATQYNEENSQEIDWQPAPRITPDDTAKNVRSLNRKLDKKLYLLVRTEEGGEWHFPQLLHQNHETMRQVVDQLVVDKFPVQEDIYVMGNAPVGHFTLPEGVAFGGAKATDTLFYYRANYMVNFIEGEKLTPPPESGWKDFVWVTNTELWNEYITGDQAEYMKKMLAVPSLLLDQ